MSANFSSLVAEALATALRESPDEHGILFKGCALQARVAA